MCEASGNGKPNVAATFLSCAIISLGILSQSKSYGAENPTQENTASLDSVASSAQESIGTSALSELQFSVQESKSIARQPSRTQRRRKPKMAAVPSGTPVLAQETGVLGTQVAAQEPLKTAAVIMSPSEDKPKAPTKIPADDKPKPEIAAISSEAIRQEEPGVDETDPFAPAKPKAQLKKTEESDPFSTPAGKDAAGLKPPKKGKSYRMAPIKWGARVTETLAKLDEKYTENKLYGQNQTVAFETNRKSFFNTQTAEVKGSTYVIQPYIAQVDGSLGITHSKENKTTDTLQNKISMSTEEESIRHNKLFGSGALALFSRSRFPFSASFNVTNSHADSAYIGSDSSSKAVFLQQDYRPLRGPDRYSAGYQLTSTTSNTAQKNSYSSLHGSYSSRLGEKQLYPFNASYRHSVTDSYTTGAVSTDIVTAQHSYLPPQSLLAVNSTGAYTLSKQDDPRGLSQQARFLQLNSVASWQPESEDIPLFVTGSGRYFDASTETAGSTFTSKTLSVNSSALWDESTNLKYHGDASANIAKSSYSTSFTTVQRVRAVYRSDDIKIKSNSYYWNTNAGLFNQTQAGSTSAGQTGNTATTATVNTTGQGLGGSGRNTRAFAGAGHSLQGELGTSILEAKWPLRYTINQDLTGNTPLTAYGRQVNPKSASLRNNVTLSSGYDKKQWAFMGSVSFTDMITWGGSNEGHTKVVAVTLGGRGKQPIYEGYGAKVDGSVQIARSSHGTMQASGALVGTYLKYGVFGIRGLSYSVRGDLESRPVPPMDTTLGDQANAGGVTRDKAVSYGLNQNLMYRIGMNELRAAALLEDRHGIKRYTLLLQFKIWRTIGN